MPETFIIFSGVVILVGLILLSAVIPLEEEDE
jgi:hypothetical protein